MLITNKSWENIAQLRNLGEKKNETQNHSVILI